MKIKDIKRSKTKKKMLIEQECTRIHSGVERLGLRSDEKRKRHTCWWYDLVVNWLAGGDLYAD